MTGINIYGRVPPIMSPKPFTLSLNNVRKDCKIRIQISLLKRIEHAMKKEHTLFFNDFVTKAITEKLERIEK